MNEPTPSNAAKPNVQFVSLYSEVSYKGALPPPALLDGYEKVLTGRTGQIFTLVTSEQVHRHKLEVEDIQHRHKLNARRQWMAFTIGVLGVVGGRIVIAMGKSIEGAATSIASICGLV